MEHFIIPENYQPALSLHDTQVGIKTVKDFFQKTLSDRLNLLRVSAPLFVDPSSGLNDNLNGVERPVTFEIKESPDQKAEIVHSLAKWKRYALKKLFVEEPEIRKMMQDAEETCEKLHMEILGGHTEITNVVKQPLISVTGVGKMKKENLRTVSQIRPDQDIIVTKWIGLEATTILAKEKEDELKKRFPAVLIDTAKDFDQYLSVVPESRIAVEHGVSSMHDITEGGIFGAFWEMASGAGVGLEVDLKKIPIRQETVEICNYFRVNPYQIMSSGSMMIAADDGHELVRKLEQAGIHAVVVGRTNSGNDRILRNGEDVRYLDKPQPDELYKVMG